MASRKFRDEVVMEFPRIGNYRVRLLRRENGESPRTVLDVREYIEGEGEGAFTGFTRRGVRLTSVEQAGALEEILREVVATRALPQEGDTGSNGGAPATARRAERTG
jgi:hypothetical protein